jgi:hypothetical protein
MFPKVTVCNETGGPLFLGFPIKKGKKGIWLAPNGETGDCYTFVGLDVNDRRIRQLLGSYAYQSSPAKITIALAETLEVYLGSTTTTTTTTGSP